MNIKRFGKSLRIGKLRIANRPPHLISDRHAVIIQLKRRIEDFVQLEEIADKISLATYSMAADNLVHIAYGSPAQVLVKHYPLSFNQFRIKLVNRKTDRQHRMLDIEQPVILGRKIARFGQLAFCARIGCIDADIDDFRHFLAPFTDDMEAFMIPVRIYRR
jgi:hypothetical protein